MSREGKGEVQLSRPSHAFPFNSALAAPQPHITQWCRFSVPERLPLQPFRQDRLNKLPLPPSLMATSKVASLSGAGSIDTLRLHDNAGDVDPFQKIQQLEKNLAFLRENHAFMLQGLHTEIADLKQKNRELQFELIIGLPALPKESSSQMSENDSLLLQKNKIEKLEKEIRKLRGALKEALKSNTSLTLQLQKLNREHNGKTSSRNKECKTYSFDDEHYIRTPNGPSPQMEEYSDTLRQIQRAANQQSGKRNERRHHHNPEGKVEWSESYLSGNGYHQHHHRHHHHHHQPQKSPQPQARLPRLPLHNQQNYSHQQYEIEYRQRSSNTLPALKQPLIPVVGHLDKPRKSRAPRPTKVDQAING